MKHGRIERHRFRTKGFLTVAALLFIFTAGTLGALDVPQLRGRINDYAGMISASTESEIEAISRNLEDSDSTQLVVLTIASLEG